MSTPDWKEDWIAAELEAEAALADPPPEAADRVLKGVLATVATGATVAGTAGTGVAAATATTAGASALWVKGLLLTGLVAGGVGLSQVEFEAPSPQPTTSAPRVGAQPARVAVGTAAPQSQTPTSSVVEELPIVAPTTEAPVAQRPPPRVPVEPRIPTVQPAQPMTSALAVRVPTRAKPPVRPATPKSPKRSVRRAKAPATRSPASIAATPARAAARRAASVQPPVAPRSASATTTYLEVNEPPQHRASTVTATDAELRVQHRILGRALRALRNKKPRSAQVYLRDYRRRFGVGRLDEEHRLITLRVHLAMGEIKAARRVADAFVEHYKNSALRPMVERLRP